MIEIESLAYFYPNAKRPALDDISFTVEPGEFLLLAGTSGAGKSTILRCLNGLVPHFSGGTLSGKITVAGLNVLHEGPARLSQKVGLVFQNPESQAVLERVEAEIAFGLENSAMPVEKMRPRVEETLALLDLTHLRDRRLTTLSGGERQKVAIATAMVMRPKILALDEPTSQLDPQTSDELMQSLARLNRELGVTIVLVEHRLERAMGYCSRLLYLEDGRLILDAPTSKGFARLRGRNSPPIVRLASTLGWERIPLTDQESRLAAGSVPSVNGKVIHPGYSFAGGMDAPPLLKATGLHFAFDENAVLTDVSLEVGSGEAVVLLGRNGSGKSTLLKCLVGLLKPAQGKIFVDGFPIANRSVAEVSQEVAYLPQYPDDLLFAESVIDELNFTLRNHGMTEAVLSQSSMSLLDELGLVAVSGEYPRDLSVGQRQRVALGAIMVTSPKLLLLDEPTRGLDYSVKQNLVGIWKTWLSAGMGLLLVTHDVEMAATIADRVIVLSQGTIVADGPASSVLGQSADFRPQVAQLFPDRGWLTVEDVFDALGVKEGSGEKPDKGLASGA